MNFDTHTGCVAVIGGGAAGMACALRLARGGRKTVLIERGDRLGKKLSATGNGQGNVTNTDISPAHYRTDDPARLSRILSRYGTEEIVGFLESMGGIFLADGRGRVYPASRQASAVTDLFRGALAKCGADVLTGVHVRSVTYDGKFTLMWDGGQMCADAVVLAAGGKAAPAFGTDGSAYALARAFGHTVTPLSPALVPLKCDPALVRGLKGIRIDGALRLVRGGETLFSGRGDILFADGGVSGDLIFRASSYAQKGDVLELDLLPDVSPEKLQTVFQKTGSLLCVLPNGLARMLAREDEVCERIKRFLLPVTGDFGFARAQVTRGGIPLGETDEGLQSLLRRGLYFAGEILHADGDCGGYNLHWAFASGLCVADAIGGKA